MTVKELKNILADVEDDSIVSLENNGKYEPVGAIDIINTTIFSKDGVGSFEIQEVILNRFVE